MKVITLWQPWAFLVARGDKKIETRSWKAPKELMGQRIAIHAAKAFSKEMQELCWTQPFRGILLKNGFNMSFSDMPLGKVVATAKLMACLKIINYQPGCLRATLENGNEVINNEYHFGDYTPGRYAWILEDIQPLEEPVQAKGMQKLWNLPLECKEMMKNE